MDESMSQSLSSLNHGSEFNEKRCPMRVNTHQSGLGFSFTREQAGKDRHIC